MIWLNLKTTTLRSPEYAGSEPIQRATWLNLLAYCCEQENGGKIEGCGGWKDRQWQQTLGVTLAEVQDVCALWHWEGETLCVAFYPNFKEDEVQARREAGKRGGSARTKAKTEAARNNGAKHNPSKHPSKHPSRTQAEPKQNPSNNPTEREWEGKDKGKETLTVVSDAPQLEDLLHVAPTLPQVIEAGRRASIPEDVCRAYHDDREGAGWLDGKGRPVKSMPHDLSGFWRKWQSNRSPKQFGNGTVASNGNPKPGEGVWHLEKRIGAAQAEISQLQGDPNNKEPVNPETPWDRRLKPDVAKRISELKTGIAAMRRQLAGGEGVAA
jgi:hypothetical protein